MFVQSGKNPVIYLQEFLRLVSGRPKMSIGGLRKPVSIPNELHKAVFTLHKNFGKFS